MPVRMDQSLLGWGDQLQNNIRLLEAVLPSLQQLGLGGTAVGTGTLPPRIPGVFNSLSEHTGIASACI